MYGILYKFWFVANIGYFILCYGRKNDSIYLIHSHIIEDII